MIIIHKYYHIIITFRDNEIFINQQDIYKLLLIKL